MPSGIVSDGECGEVFELIVRVGRAIERLGGRRACARPPVDLEVRHAVACLRDEEPDSNPSDHDARERDALVNEATR